MVTGYGDYIVYLLLYLFSFPVARFFSCLCIHTLSPHPFLISYRFQGLEDINTNGMDNFSMSVVWHPCLRRCILSVPVSVVYHTCLWLSLTVCFCLYMSSTEVYFCLYPCLSSTVLVPCGLYLSVPMSVVYRTCPMRSIFVCTHVCRLPYLSHAVYICLYPCLSSTVLVPCGLYLSVPMSVVYRTCPMRSIFVCTHVCRLPYLSHAVYICLYPCLSSTVLVPCGLYLSVPMSVVYRTCPMRSIFVCTHVCRLPYLSHAVYICLYPCLSSTVLVPCGLYLSVPMSVVYRTCPMRSIFVCTHVCRLPYLSHAVYICLYPCLSSTVLVPCGLYLSVPMSVVYRTCPMRSIFVCTRVCRLPYLSHAVYICLYPCLSSTVLVPCGLYLSVPVSVVHRICLGLSTSVYLYLSSTVLVPGGLLLSVPVSVIYRTCLGQSVFVGTYVCRLPYLSWAVRFGLNQSCFVWSICP